MASIACIRSVEMLTELVAVAEQEHGKRITCRRPQWYEHRLADDDGEKQDGKKESCFLMHFE